ncbi:hypothetical protein MBLNU457_4926t1 [Dothideomycetes sp. NU457]
MPLNITSQQRDQDSLREARRHVASLLRNDWSYPSLSQYASTTSQAENSALVNSEQLAAQTAQKVNHDQSHNGRASDIVGEVVAWQERDYSSDEAGLDGDGPYSLGSASAPGSPSTNSISRKSGVSSAEIVAEADRTKAGRKRKRARIMEEEMSWNAGLAHFVARRNAWTCAREVHRAGHVPRGRKLGDVMQDVNGDVDVHTAETDSEDARMEDENEEEEEDSDLPAAANSSLSDARTLLPIPRPLLPDHPVRKKINPNTYGEIYSKIILQSRTPTIPINLAHIVNALIHGWKQEGNWPPKGTAAEPPIGTRRKSLSETVGQRHPHLKKGVQAVGRVLGIGI